jgi:hypothetical protein
MNLQQNEFHERSMQISKKMSHMMETSEIERMELLKEEIFEMFDRLETEKSTLISL